MSNDRATAIALNRRQQPMAELERKWKKAKGRWSNQYWSAEWIDLAEKRADEMMEKLRRVESFP